jgi:hypothetical protein
MNIAGHLFLFCAAVVYFRAAFTTDRDFDLWKEMVGRGRPVGPLDVKFCNYIRRIGPLPLYNIRVLAFALLLCLPPILWRFLSESWSFGFLLCAAFGAFLAPLTTPTVAESDARDLYSPQWFLLKWIVGKIDVYLKLLVAWGALWLFAKIPIVGHLPSSIAGIIFPVIKKNEIATHLFEFLEFAPFVLVVMLLLRWSIFVAHGYVYSSLALLCTGWIWIQYQWFFDKVVGEPQVLLSFSHSVILIWLSEFLLSFVSAVLKLPEVKKTGETTKTERKG